MKLDIRVEDITPKRAEEWLGRNHQNRHLSPHRVNTLAREMTAGRWALNGESLKLNGDGSLKDGQHRLAAVVQSGVTIKSVVVYGIGSAEQETIDTGWRRTNGDVLSLRGETDSAQLAGAIVLCWKIENKLSLAGGGYVYPTHSEVTEYLDANPNIRFSVPIGRRANKTEVRFPASRATALHYLMTKMDAAQADSFWVMLSEGTGLTAQHPIQILRRQLLRDLSLPRHMHDQVRNALTIKAWNAFRNGTTPRAYFVWRASGPAAETFPEIQ